MKRPSKFDRLPTEIKNATIGKMLAGYGCVPIAEWLKEQGEPINKSSVHRESVKIRAKFEPLIKLGMPIETIVYNLALIEADTVEVVAAELAERLKAKSSLFAYLDSAEANP